MSKLAAVIDDLVAANHILAAQGVVDAFGHVSVRHPDDPTRFLLSRARSPECIEADDIMEFSLDGTPVEARGRKPYIERFIHSAVYEARGDVNGVVHSHSRNLIPFGVGGEKLRPLAHYCAVIGYEVPIWDIRTVFGDTDLLVTNTDQGRDLARFMGGRAAVLMRGHGATVAASSMRLAVYTAIYLQVNADLQREAARYDEVVYLSPGEIDRLNAWFKDSDNAQLGLGRAWEYWCRRSGVIYKPAP